MNNCEQNCFRFVAYQPISLTLDTHEPFKLLIQNIHCRFFLWPIHADESMQRTHGGTFVAVDFSLTNEIDLLIAAKKGLDIIDDLFSAISLIEGTALHEAKPVEIVLHKPDSQNYRILHFLKLPTYQWKKPISQKTLDDVQGFLAHWDMLDSGKRLRRAAHLYFKATGIDDIFAAFQYTYMGMESIEKPLADVMNIPSGVEEIKGNCAKCGEEYTKYRSVLAGVRAYICGDIHHEMATPERKEEWKNINEIRHKMFHSIEDSNELEEEVHRFLPAAMHHLHDAICCLSHAHNLESSLFKLIGGARQIVLVGQFCSDGIGSLEQWRPFIEDKGCYWIEHPKHGLIPEFNIKNSGLKDLEAAIFWLNIPFGTASEKDLIPTHSELNKTGNNMK